MAWEQRARGGSYYTRSRREGGRIVREYIGGGELGMLLSRFDEADREEAQAQREMEREARASEQQRNNQLDLLCEATDRLVQQTLTEAGYHQHKRGEWRKKRVGKENSGSDAEQAP